MDLVNLIIDPERIKNTCFLCLNTDENNTTLYEDVDIQDEAFKLSVKTSLRNIMRNLFPNHEILTGQACKDCTTLVTKMYFKLQLNIIKRELFSQIIDCINNEIILKCDLQGRIEIMLSSHDTYNQTNSHLKRIHHLHSMAIRDTENINTKFESKTCSTSFDSKQLLLQHKRVLHKNGTDSKICHICGKNYTTTKSLNTHLNCHKEKQCPYCLKNLKSSSHFYVHIKNHKCATRTKHKKTYVNCEHCSYKSINKSDLQAHNNKMHLNIRPHVCHICLKSFYKKGNLNEHSLTHRDVKNVTCEICGENFSCKKSLSNHLKLHNGERQYECLVCNRRFVTISRKNEHVKRNHGNSYEICTICGKKYALKKDLNVHMKRIHQI